MHGVGEVPYGAGPFIRKSISSIVRKIRHIHWELGKLSVYFAAFILPYIPQANVHVV